MYRKRRFIWDLSDVLHYIHLLLGVPAGLLQNLLFCLTFLSIQNIHFGHFVIYDQRCLYFALHTCTSSWCQYFGYVIKMQTIIGVPCIVLHTTPKYVSITVLVNKIPSEVKWDWPVTVYLHFVTTNKRVSCDTMMYWVCQVSVCRYSESKFTKFL